MPISQTLSLNVLLELQEIEKNKFNTLEKKRESEEVLISIK